MHMSSTDFLELIAKNGCHIVLERGAPAGRLKREFAFIKTNDGRDFELRTPQGYRICPLELPRAILDDYLRASFVIQDGEQDSNSRIVFRLTTDGRTRGHA